MEIVSQNQPRIFGIETEYGIHPFRDAISNEDINQALPDYLHPTDNGFSEFGRIYADQHTNVEVSTPELISLKGLIATYFAGEELASTVIKNIFGNRTAAVKRSVDSNMVPRGEHENYLAGTALLNTDLYILSTHLATRPVVTGPGMVYFVSRSKGYHYMTDQRGLKTTGEVFNPLSTGTEKPFMKVNNIPYDNSKNSRRIEVLTGSHNMYAYPIAARVFNTSAAIRLLEHGRWPDNLIVDSPSRVIVSTASDPTLAAKVRMKGGKKYTALQVQHQLMTEVLKLDLPDDERSMARLTATITADLMEGRYEPWQNHIEWLGKKAILEQHAEKNGYDFPNATSAEIDIKMHYAGQDTLINSLRQKGKVAMMPNQKDVQLAMRRPVDPTRAQLRYQAIAEAARAGIYNRNVSWNYWEFGSQERITVNDAYACTPDQIAA